MRHLSFCQHVVTHIASSSVCRQSCRQPSRVMLLTEILANDKYPATDYLLDLLEMFAEGEYTAELARKLFGGPKQNSCPTNVSVSLGYFGTSFLELERKILPASGFSRTALHVLTELERKRNLVRCASCHCSRWQRSKISLGRWRNYLAAQTSSFACCLLFAVIPHVLFVERAGCRGDLMRNLAISRSQKLFA